MPKNTSASNSTSSGQPGDLLLSPIQLAWITEIGINPRFLRPYVKSQSQNTNSVVQSGIKPVVKPQAKHPAKPEVKPALTPVQKPDFDNLESLHSYIQTCTACSLHAQRHNAVVGMGNTDSPDWFIVGESPGRLDDKTGLPFQGEAGQLLQAMLLSIGLRPHNVQLGNGVDPVVQWASNANAFYTNLIKCQPLLKRRLTSDNINQCLPYLHDQLDFIKPKKILAMGVDSAQSLLQVAKPLEELRGTVHYINTPGGLRIPLVATWLPASLLVQPHNKPLAWADLQMARNI